METKPLIFGLIGFFLGGLIVSIAAANFANTALQSASHEVPMSEMTSSLRDKRGDDYDSLFISHMIEHHQAAVDMSRLSAQKCKARRDQTALNRDHRRAGEGDRTNATVAKGLGLFCRTRPWRDGALEDMKIALPS